MLTASSVWVRLGWRMWAIESRVSSCCMRACHVWWNSACVPSVVSIMFMVSFLPAYDAHGRARCSFKSDKVLFTERDKAGGHVGRSAAYHMVNDADAENLRGFDQAAGDVAILLAGGRVAGGVIVLCVAPIYVELRRLCSCLLCVAIARVRQGHCFMTMPHLT